MTEAEQYAIIYPDRAVLIRDNRGVPGWVTFDRPSEGLAQALIGGRGPVFDELDSIAEEMRAKNPCNVKDRGSPLLGGAAVNLSSNHPMQSGEPSAARHPREPNRNP